MPIVHLHTDNFSEFIEKNQIVIVDFWAEWCAPCLAFGKIYEQAAAKYKQLGFGKVDIEEHPELAELFQIRSIPHLVIFKEGIAIYSEAGSMPASTLEGLIEQAISADVSKIKNELGDEEI